MKKRLILGAVTLAVSTTPYALPNGKPFAELQAQIDQTNLEIEALKAKVEANAVGIIEIRGLIEQQNQNIDAILVELEANKIAIQEAMALASDAMSLSASTVQELELTKSEIHLAITGIKDSIETLKQDLKTLSDALDSSNTAFQVSIDELRAAVELNEFDISGLVTNLAITTAEVATNNSKIGALTSRIVTLEADVSTHETLLAEIDGKIAAAVDSISSNTGGTTKQISFVDTGKEVNDISTLDLFTKLKSLYAETSDYLYVSSNVNGQTRSAVCIANAGEILGLFHAAPYTRGYSSGNTSYGYQYTLPLVRSFKTSEYSYLDSSGSWATLSSSYVSIFLYNYYVSGDPAMNNARFLLSGSGAGFSVYPNGDLYGSYELSGSASEDITHIELIMKTGSRQEACGF